MICHAQNSLDGETMIYEYKEHNIDKDSEYAWTDRKGNILRVPDDSWDPVLRSKKAIYLNAFLKKQGYYGPSDWNPR